jgi:hypothetical protein
LFCTVFLLLWLTVSVNPIEGQLHYHVNISFSGLPDMFTFRDFLYVIVFLYKLDQFFSFRKVTSKPLEFIYVYDYSSSLVVRFIRKVKIKFWRIKLAITIICGFHVSDISKYIEHEACWLAQKCSLTVKIIFCLIADIWRYSFLSLFYCAISCFNFYNYLLVLLFQCVPPKVPHIVLSGDGIYKNMTINNGSTSNWYEF